MLSKILESIGRPIHSLLKIILLILLYLLNTITKSLSLLINLKIPKIKFKKIPKKKPKKSPKQKRLIKSKKFLKKKIHISLSIEFFSLLGAVVFIGAFFYFTIIKDLPSPKNLKTRNQPVTTQILDRNGNLLYKIYKDENRSLIPLSNLNQHTIDATIAIEDQDFYQHTGVSIKGIIRAFQRNVFDNKIQGGSTITQQLVKNALLSPEKTLIRKLKEVILAVAVELTYSKEEILEMYFNEVGYGGAVYGIKEASNYYFGKSPENLNLEESALLAGLPAAPTIYSPFGANPELSLVRQHEVLRRMVEEEFISNQQADIAKAQKIQLISPRNNIQAPHFVMYIKDLLVQKYGENLVHQGGLSVTTTIDLNLQQFAQKTLEEELDNLKHLNVTNGAILIINPKNGDILTMIGSKDYFDIENDGQVNVVQRLRQPGSAIKPITYTLAFEKGFSPISRIDDSPITYRVPGSPPYSPKNYDNTFHGNINLKTALANSYNVPAVKLLSHLGVNNLIEKAKLMGISTWNDSSRFGLSLTLGGGDIKMIDLTTVYASLANKGIKNQVSPILTIYDQNQDQIFSKQCPRSTSQIFQKTQWETVSCNQEIVTSPLVAFQISNILSDNILRSRTFGTYSKLNIDSHQVAVKTGTTNNLRDNWTIGYTSDFVVAVWVGNNDNSPMSNVASGITGATPIWNKIMTHILTNKSPHIFEVPDDMVEVSICTLTQSLPCQSCPHISKEIYLKGTEPTHYCTEEIINKILTPKVDDLPRDQILEGASTTNN